MTWATGCFWRLVADLAVGGAFFGTPALPAGELAIGVVPGALLDVGPVELVVGVVLDEAAEVVLSCADCVGCAVLSSSTFPAQAGLAVRFSSPQRSNASGWQRSATPAPS